MLLPTLLKLNNSKLIVEVVNLKKYEDNQKLVEEN